MANINRIIFILLILFSTASYSTTVDLSNQSNFAKSSSGLMWATQTSGAPTGALITGNRASVPFSYNVPSGQSLVPVSGVRESNLSLNRIGKAVTNFANRVGPVAVGIAIAGAVCDLTDICNIDDVWQKTADPDLAGYPQQTGLISYFVAGFSPNFPTQELVCSFAADFYNTSVTFNSGNNKCEGSGVSLFVSQNGSCPTNYTQSGNQCIADFSTENTIATDDDWTNVETALNDPQFIQPLFDAGEPLPVEQPDPFPPVNTITGSTTKTIRDGDGNITGTEVTENTLTLSDVSSPDSPNLVDVTETKKVTTYDINNNITNTETSVSNPPPIEPPTEEQDQDIEFDDMAENELEEYEIPEINDFSSWGSGTCPPPIDIVTTHWNGQIDTQPICTYAEGLKPFVLLIAALSSAFIISGSRQNVEV